MAAELATRPATQFENSPGWLAKARAELEATTAAADVLAQFARLSAAFGDGRIADPASRQLLLREWLEAFGPHNPRHLHEAVTVAIQTVRFWPAIAEVLAEVRSLRKSIVDGVQRQNQIRLPRPQKDDFARHGRSEAQEMAFRAAIVRDAKKAYGWKGEEAPPAPEGEPDPVPYVVPASDASEALRASLMRRARQ
jgi:hypothetical protein